MSTFLQQLLPWYLSSGHYYHFTLKMIRFRLVLQCRNLKSISGGKCIWIHISKYSQLLCGSLNFVRYWLNIFIVNKVELISAPQVKKLHAECFQWPLSLIDENNRLGNPAIGVWSSASRVNIAKIMLNAPKLPRFHISSLILLEKVRKFIEKNWNMAGLKFSTSKPIQLPQTEQES